jgi:hypothetical protein
LNDRGCSLVGEFFTGDGLPFSCLVGGGVGEEGVSGGFPSGSGIGESADDERGFFVNVVLTMKALLVVSGAVVLAAPVADACVA